jgi:hypothetical protein
MGRIRGTGTDAIEAFLEDAFVKGEIGPSGAFTARSSFNDRTVAKTFGKTHQRVFQIRSRWWKERSYKAANSNPDALQGSQPAGGPAAKKTTGPALSGLDEKPAPVVVGLKWRDPFEVPKDADLAMFLQMPEARWTRDDARTLNDEARRDALYAMHSFRGVPESHIARMFGFVNPETGKADVAAWKATLDVVLKTRLVAWRSKGVARKVHRMSDLADFARDDISLSAATKLLEASAPESFGPAAQKLVVESHVVEERIVYLGDRGLFEGGAGNMLQGLVDEGALARPVIEGTARELPAHEESA